MPFHAGPVWGDAGVLIYFGPDAAPIVRGCVWPVAAAGAVDCGRDSADLR